MDILQLRNKYPDHWRKACAIRVLSMDAVQAANSGHPGMPMGMADVATVLFGKHLKFYADDPHWPDRDRFILSAGHGSMLLYSLLYLLGYKDFTIEQLQNFRQLGFRTAGHPEYGHGAGVETTTGPLGQGLANAVGFAIAEEALRSRFGEEIVDHFTYALAGDGCLMEGISHEAIGLAGKQELSKLIVLWDDNNITIDGKVSLSDDSNQLLRFEAAGWQVLRCDGHNPDEIDAVLSEAKESPLPSMIACKTVIGIGSPAKQGTAAAHGAPLGVEEVAATRETYGWSLPPFDLPAEIKNEWRNFGQRGSKSYDAWKSRLSALPNDQQEEFDRVLSRKVPNSLFREFAALKNEVTKSRPTIATRKSSQLVLERINPVLPEMMGGSADLTGSNNTKTADLGVFDTNSRGSRYIYYGIREHGMAAAMNGMALHGGIRPYGGTFLCFTDYARPSIRLAALMGLPVIYVMTHDSIGLGEDGPTHQPVEHLSILRSTPNLRLFRPCDTVETAEAWELAILSESTPSVIALSRQGLPTLRGNNEEGNETAKGAYVLADWVSSGKALLLATGSEVAIAIQAREALQAEGIGTRVVSMPCWESFAEQDTRYRNDVLPQGTVRVGIEAAARQGWDRWLSGEGGSESKAAFIGMDSFGASAPGGDLYEHFNITSERVVETVKSLL